MLVRRATARKGGQSPHGTAERPWLRGGASETPVLPWFWSQRKSPGGEPDLRALRCPRGGRGRPARGWGNSGCENPGSLHKALSYTDCAPCVGATVGPPSFGVFLPETPPSRKRKEGPRFLMSVQLCADGAACTLTLVLRNTVWGSACRGSEG